MELLAFLVAFVVSMACAPAGVSGAFLLLPLQMYIFGVAAPSATSTNLFYNLFATPPGIFRYAKERRLMLKLSLLLIASSIPGFAAGVAMRTTFLVDPKIFRNFVAAVLFAVAARLAFDLAKKSLEQPGLYVEERLGRIRGGGRDYAYSPSKVAAASAAVGIVGGAYGIGGGALMSPILAAVFKLPIYATAGSTLLATFASSAFGVFLYNAAGHPPNWHVAIPMAIGGATGVYTGAYLQRRIPPTYIKATILAITLILAVENLTA